MNSTTMQAKQSKLNRQVLNAIKNMANPANPLVNEYALLEVFCDQRPMVYVALKQLADSGKITRLTEWVTPYATSRKQELIVYYKAVTS